MHFPEVFNDSELDGALKAVHDWMLKEVDAPFGLVVDVQRPLAFSAVQRKMIADVEKSYRHVDRRYNGGQAVVVPTAVARGVLTAVYWLSPPVYPVQAVATLEEGLEWVENSLRTSLDDYPDGPGWLHRGK